MSVPDATLKRTPLYERHQAAGARLVPFAGWEMPVQYEGVRQEHLAVRGKVGVFDVSHMGQIETRGPQATELLQRLLSNDVDKMKVGGAQYSVLCREDGVELLLAPEHAENLWDKLLNSGATPAGLAARDTLRTEVCYPLYGNDLSEARGPIEAGLGWCAKEDTGFIGSEAVRGVREAGPAEKLAAFALDGSGIARQGNPVLGGGEVTSGTFSPTLEKGIGMAYLPADRAQPGTAIDIDVRGRTRSATVAEKPLYRRPQ